MSTLANSEDPDDMLHDVLFAKTKSLLKKRNAFIYYININNFILK